MNDNELIQHSKTWDRTGVVIASLCLLHCLAFPFIIALIPASKVIFGSEIFEVSILSLGVIIGGFSFYTSFKKHQKLGPISIGIAGMCFLIFDLVFMHSQSGGEDHHHHLLDLDIDLLMISGGAFLIAGHLWNIRECHCFCDSSCGHPEHKTA